MLLQSTAWDLDHVSEAAVVEQVGIHGQRAFLPTRTDQHDEVRDLRVGTSLQERAHA